MSDRHHESVPRWATLMNEVRFERFMSLVRATLEGTGNHFEVGDGVVTVARAAGATAALGLGNLLQLCQAAPLDDWPQLVTSHLTALLEVGDGANDAPGQRLLQRFDLARPSLRVRLWPRQQVHGLLEVVTREDLPGVATTLVLDLPRDIRALTARDIAAWGVPTDELLAIGLENVRRHCPPYASRFEPLAPVTFLTSRDRDYYAASHVLLLGSYSGCVGKHGALVGVPHRHLAVVHAIEDRRVFAALEHLGSFVRRCFDEGPGSIDPDLFWFRDGRFTRLSFVPGKDGALHFTPSAEFGAVLDQLGDPA